ncbi:50S ribosomal protein L25/general stress protein Ctc [Motilimonas cestriensis]|uniref:Large ribosomal subunit protein bL25 n=1 Tax=Motilimonas cestriensis TaxID=2742685 RepID=A0ABS8W6Y7_9GAMM|nr:50S ribosomal protein L25/general stress protein Ctc [Motilimonas cestriensis]MCE2593569.1 50S ribosomal protein L25/general stress protein Ctc [Motilimonas cestriensis]
MSTITLNAEVRADLGKGASRRLRHADKVPAILYGAGQEAVSLTLSHNSVIKVNDVEAFYTSVITLNVDGKEVQAVLKDIQRHPFKPKIQHLDFLRVDATQKLQTVLPLHFINEDTAASVKAGGVLAKTAHEVEVSCLPGALPEFIEVDVNEIELGQTIHISDLKLPEGVESVELAKGADHDQAVATVATAKGAASAEEEAAE